MHVEYWLTRLCFQRALAFVYLIAFLIAAIATIAVGVRILRIDADGFVVVGNGAVVIALV